MEENSPLKRFLPLLVIVVLVLLVSSLITQISAVRPDKDAYQSVFMTNGDIYFGKLEDVGSDYPSLTDVYYLKRNPQNSEENPQPPLTLIKYGVGNEVHGPEDQIFLNKEHILHWENLNKDTGVAKKIEEEKAARAKAASQPASPAPVASPAQAPGN